MVRVLWPVVMAVLLLVAPGLTMGVAVAQNPAYGIDPANMDFGVSPREDFYRFANGGWLEQTEIPDDKSSYGTFTELYDITLEQLLAILDEAVSGDRALAPGSDEDKAVRMWQQGIDIDARNAAGLTPIAPILAEIDAISDLAAYHEFLQGAMFYGLTGSLPIGVSPDLRDSGINAVYLGGPWLGLPNRDYYLEEGNEAVRDAYVATNANMLERLGREPEDARAAAQAVYDLEASLAATTLTREDRQNPELSYNPLTVAELGERYPGMDWRAYLEELDIADTDRLIATQVGYLDALDGILEQTSIETLRDYLRLQLLWDFSNNLDLDLEETAFTFLQSLGGAPTMPPVEERALSQTSGLMGDALGRLYVAEHFPPEAKQEMEALVARIVAAFGDRLEHNEWMTPETREKALAKLATLRVKVGYPDEWETYEDVEIGESYAETVLSAANASLRESLAEAGQPVDREEWGMNAQTANAYYSPLNNEIVFPAAILQRPFFDYRADPASNYGAIGFIIGHEITHGFDLQGSRFDANGNLEEWWTAEDRARFEALNQDLVAQYDAIEVLPDLFINGQLTVTENVADLGGIETAYDAFQSLLDEQGAVAESESSAASRTGDNVADLTPDQRFFIAAATVWRGKMRDEALTTRIRSGVHSPPAVRATQPLRNTDEFYEAFGIVEGDPMYLAPAERVRIW
ncbi:MAG TPA: M13 family metallopeptidase [Gemmatimonadales bacterium]|nr:M13 family metallopeptidase [Gemmatimonadales bacterium]